MVIDGCSQTFERLARQRLPSRMREMRQAMRKAFPMSEIGRRGNGPKTLLRRFDRTEDFPGCYVLIERGKPVYVGISRGVVKRLLQHAKGATHYDASLAYRMAKSRRGHELTRSEAMEQQHFKDAFQRAKKRILRMSVAFTEIDSAVELHLFEVYCAMKLDTSKWNTFRTH